MINIYLKEFVDGWLEKAKAYDGITLLSAFDKFFTYFVVYNTLYNEATNRLIVSGVVVKKGDAESATVNTLRYIGEDILAQRFREGLCLEGINEVVNLIESGVFYIHSKPNGQVDYVKDQTCLRGITRGNNTEFCNAVLVLLYKTRCNMFHGSKEYSHIQKKILEPMNIILKCVIDTLLVSLDEA